MTDIRPITPDSLAAAGEALREGRVVAFPTETVYGLGGNAENDRAVAAIFAAKDRPRFNPLIVHVPHLAAARRYGALPKTAEALAARFWPGPLSLVVPQHPESRLSRLVSAGLDTVALRVPAHEDARALLRAAEVPVAAPSANPSGRLSPTTAQHVAAELGDRVAMILDAGPCAVGLESTVLDLSTAEPTLLRPGGVTAEELETALGRPLARPLLRAGGDPQAPKSPGMMSSHYAPRLPVRLNATAPEKGEALLGFGQTRTKPTLNLSTSGDLVEAAARLFACLHELDRPDFTGIAVAPIPEQGLGRAINDRLRRAAADRD